MSAGGLSLFIDGLPVHDLAGDMMLASLFGGVIMGVGLGMVVRSGATTGGTDMAAMIVHEHWNFLTVPMVLFAIDTVVVIIAAMAFGLQAGLFALVSLFISTKAMRKSSAASTARSSAAARGLRRRAHMRAGKTVRCCASFRAWKRRS